MKAECVRVNQQLGYVQELEQRVRELERQLQYAQGNSDNVYAIDAGAEIGRQLGTTAVKSAASHHNHLATPESLTGTTAASTPASADIGPAQPLAHDVGLLSLAQNSEPRYLGPSSGVTFARLIYAAAPQSQGLPAPVANAQTQSASGSQGTTGAPGTRKVEPAPLPAETELRYFVDAYFDVWHPSYPFLDEAGFQTIIDRVYVRQRDTSRSCEAGNVVERASASMDAAQCFLVFGLGASILESRLGTDFGSDGLYAAAMQQISTLQLHDSLRGVQTMLLLVISSFAYPQGLNAWFLLSTVIASCLDLGLQRRQVSCRQDASEFDTAKQAQHEDRRSAVFWSAYSLERTLSVLLGRPLTLRDEAIDIQFPGHQESNELQQDALATKRAEINPEPPTKRLRIEESTPCIFEPAIFSFRYDRIVAEIKLSVYRVVQAPERFPWPTKDAAWQKVVHDTCSAILKDAEQASRRRAGRMSEHTLNTLALKHHRCLMILYRPSPAFPEPSATALRACYDSSVEILRIHHDMHRFSTLVSTWLAAHAGR